MNGNESPSRDVTAFRKVILEHYASSGRSFPWRDTRDPYRILVSEMMLQQTQTQRVVPKYNEWLEAFPDAASLARAPLPAVIERWVGLGYNRRAKYLQDACKIVTGVHGGIFPREAELLQELPGVGPYTARAVTTFAFNVPQVFIETNIRSVFLFFFFPEEREVHDSRLFPLIEETLDRENPREWYYALMDYGAELKRKTVNPNRQSRQYSRQSKFEGSLRQARGAIVRYLSSTGEASIEAIADCEGISRERIRDAMTSLARDGMVAERDELYTIPR